MQSVQKHTLTPEWDEDLYVMVQEPKTQSLRVQMFDRDLLNVKACALYETCQCQLFPPPPPERRQSPLKQLHAESGAGDAAETRGCSVESQSVLCQLCQTH